METVPPWLKGGAGWTEKAISRSGARPAESTRTFRVNVSGDDITIESKTRNRDGDDETSYSPDDLQNEGVLLESVPQLREMVNINGEDFFAESNDFIQSGSRTLECIKLVRYQKKECDRCGGSGECSDCSNSGQCPTCGGSRECQTCSAEGNCTTCDGSGNCTYCDGSSKCSNCDGTAQCPDCEGSGTMAGADVSGEECGDCAGSGNCPVCEGGGKCTECEGRGRLRNESGFVRCPSCNETGKCVNCQGYGKCATCRGTGQTLPDAIASQCTTCGGNGKCTICSGSGHCVECKGSRACPRCRGTTKCGDCSGSGKCSDCASTGNCQLCNGSLKCRDCGGIGKALYGSEYWFEASTGLRVRVRKNCNGAPVQEMDLLSAPFLGIAAPGPMPGQQPGEQRPAYASQSTYPQQAQPGSFQPLSFEQPLQVRTDTGAPGGPLRFCPSCGGAVKSPETVFCTFCGKPVK